MLRILTYSGIRKFTMSDDIVVQLDKAYYVRSKISYYPLSHSILPVPDGLSVVIFRNQKDIDQYFQIRGVNDPENFEILPIISFYDFMREVAGIGFIGVWFFNNFPILFGNYISEIDIDLPSFAFTFDSEFIGASGEIDRPKRYLPWRNFAKTDKMIRRFVMYVNGVPFNPQNILFSIVSSQSKNNDYVILNSGSPLQGAYVSDLGAYCLFTEKEEAEKYLPKLLEDGSPYKLKKIDNIYSFLNSISDNFPFVDIGINPGSERYLQAYFLRDTERWLLKTVLGIYELTDDCRFVNYEGPLGNEHLDTVERPNSIDPMLRGIKTTIKSPLKTILGTTKSSLPRREASRLIAKILNESKYNKSSKNGNSKHTIKAEDIASDSFLVFAFDKVSGIPFSNNDEAVTPYIFQDIIDAILYFYYVHFSFDYSLRLEGYFYCQTNTQYPGSENKEIEKFVLSEQRLALEELVELVLVDGYKIEHAELLKNYINRISVSLEIEECGYLGDMAIYRETFIDEYSTVNECNISSKIAKAATSYKSRIASKIDLDESCQNRIRIYLGDSYNNLSIESLCILESSLKQFEGTEQHMNHDYAGISMKLCKVFEREMIILILQKWKEKGLKNISKSDMKLFFKEAENSRDMTTQKLIGWVLKKNKLELGPLGFVFKRIADRCDNDILLDLKNYISTLKNSDFLQSQSLQDAIKEISTKYRNGGVHEKIVTYEICAEAFDKILTGENCYLKKLAST